MDLLLINDENKTHYVHIKDFNDVCFIRQKMKIKNTFADIFYNVLVDRTQRYLFKHRWFN